MEMLLSVAWSGNHSSYLINVLNVFREKNLYTDVTIACEGKFFNVHKLVLSAFSDYFSAIFDQTVCSKPIIILKDIKCENLEALINFMYIGEASVHRSDLDTFLNDAKCLGIKILSQNDGARDQTENTEDHLQREENRSFFPAQVNTGSVVTNDRDAQLIGGQGVGFFPIKNETSSSLISYSSSTPMHIESGSLTQSVDVTVQPSPNLFKHEENFTPHTTSGILSIQYQGYQPSYGIESTVKCENGIDDQGRVGATSEVEDDIILDIVGNDPPLFQ